MWLPILFHSSVIFSFFHHLQITIVVREGENETHGLNGEFHEKWKFELV